MTIPTNNQFPGVPQTPGLPQNLPQPQAAPSVQLPGIPASGASVPMQVAQPQALPTAQPIAAPAQQFAAPAQAQQNNNFTDPLGNVHASYSAFIDSLPVFQTGAVEVLESNLAVPGRDRNGVIKQKFDISVEVNQSNQIHIDNIINNYNNLLMAVTGGVQPSFSTLKQKQMKVPGPDGKKVLVDKPGFLRTRFSTKEQPGVVFGDRLDPNKRMALGHELGITPKSIVDIDFKLLPVKFTDKKTNELITGVSFIVLAVHIIQLAEAYQPRAAQQAPAAQAPIAQAPIAQTFVQPTAQPIQAPGSVVGTNQIYVNPNQGFTGQ